MKKTYRVEIAPINGDKIVHQNMDRSDVRDKVDSVLFRAARIESIYISFTDGSRVIVTEE